MKCRVLIYVNKDDPRLFIYKHPKWKWVGITLNFAHRASFVILLFTIFSVIVPLLPPLLARGKAEAHIVSIVLLFVWLVALTLYYYKRAASDLKKYPGDPSAR